MPIFKKRKKHLKIEDAIHAALSGDAQKNALAFAAFLRANDLSIEKIDVPGGWNVNEGKINIAFVQIFGDRNEFNIVLHISTYDGKSPADDGLKEFAWAHVVLCPQGCGGPTFCNESQNRRTILGKEYESTCQSPLAFINPSAHDLIKAQKLILMFLNRAEQGGSP